MDCSFLEPCSTPTISGETYVQKVSPTDANALLAVNAINGTSTSDLILGTTVHDGTLTGNPGVLADDFDLTNYASCDNASVVKTVFPTPVTTIFI